MLEMTLTPGKLNERASPRQSLGLPPGLLGYQLNAIALLPNL
jgi:hypothetical protein